MLADVIGLALAAFLGPLIISAVSDNPNSSVGRSGAAYLFDLATMFTTFYEACRVLVDDVEVRTARLALCDLTARTLSLGLSLLGMEAPQQM